MALEFKKATKTQARLRMALIGPAGSGKTYSALAIATNLGSSVAVIDTERGSASKYADVFAFDSLELESFSPDLYVEAIQSAERAGYDVLVIDSLSHAWMGKDGALEQVDAAAKRERGNSFGAWRNVTPKHNALIDAIVGSKCHIISTMRSKTEYAQEKDDRGRTVIKKIGLAPIQRDGIDFEHDVVGDMDQDNNLLITKSRCQKLTNKVINKPGKDVAEILKAWLTDGAVEPPKTTPQAPKPTNGAAKDWSKLVTAFRMGLDGVTSLEAMDEMRQQANVTFPADTTPKDVRNEIRQAINDKIAALVPIPTDSVAVVQ